jgi:xylose isomerase
MSGYFKHINEINFEGESSNHFLSFKFYDKNKVVLGKRIKQK